MWSNIWSAMQKNIANLPSFEILIWGTVKDALKILLLYLLSRIAIRVLVSVINKLLRSRAVKMQERKRKTLESLLDNLTRYSIYFIFGLMVLQAIGLKITTLLAGAGIAGVALGFGAQSLIKDILTGFFILFEDQYGVGDLVKINNFTGTVQGIGLRLTRIQAWTGEVEVIPNGQILQVTNYSRTNSLAVIDVGVGYHTNLDEAIEILRRVMSEVKAETDVIVGDVQILGVQSLRQSDILLRVTAECLPTQQYGVQRRAQQKIKQAFDEAGIEFPSLQNFTPPIVAGPMPGKS
ncbi:MAG: hypothetical protein A2201_07530 [Alicyclobacillus sp. RIFOXYA1_FULL_53_8]|nr:MAG: hypothetical protein A2201_07530 [Alicyclobacillus sp. RIFOXYA1_FULL_53_8]